MKYDDCNAVLPVNTSCKEGTSSKDKCRESVGVELAAAAFVIAPSDFTPVVLSHTDPKTLMVAAAKRLRKELPNGGWDPRKPEVEDEKKLSGKKWNMRGVRDTTYHTCRKYLTPLEADVDLSVEAWLESSNYNMKDRNRLYKVAISMRGWFVELRGSLKRKWIVFLNKIYPCHDDVYHDIWRDNQGGSFCDGNFEWDDRYYRCKSFVKSECYMDYKHARWINSRSDQFKVLTGPAFKAIEHEVFTKIPFFIKKVPVLDRPKYIHDLMNATGAVYAVSDYSSFECSIHPKFMKSCELRLYRYMLRNVPGGGLIMSHIDKALTGIQHCRAASCLTKTWARMSGDMCTSLGNGWTNLIMAMYWAKIRGFEMCGIVEGDDGLFRYPSSDDVPPKEFYADLGFEIKMETVETLNEGGFCKMYYAPGEFHNLQDPLPALLKTGWTLSSKRHAGPKKMTELLRAKGLSLACEAPRCPILCSLAKWILRCTEGFDAAAPEGWWEREIRKGYQVERGIGLLATPPSEGQRQMVDKLWNIPVQTQLSIEKWMDSQNKLVPNNCPELVELLHERFPAWHNRRLCGTVTHHKGARW